MTNINLNSSSILILSNFEIKGHFISNTKQNNAGLSSN